MTRMTGIPVSTLHDWAAKQERRNRVARTASLQIVIPASALDAR